MVILCSLTKVVIFRFFSKRKDESHNFISMEMHFRFCIHGFPFVIGVKMSLVISPIDKLQCTMYRTTSLQDHDGLHTSLETEKSSSSINTHT